MDKKIKNKGIEIQNSIRKILFEDWDPIGINKDAPDDEYDAYIGGVYRILSNNGTEEELLDYLHKVAIESIGIPEHDKNLNKEVAKKLFKLNIKL